MTGLWLITNGVTRPPLGDIGGGMLICSAMWVFVASVLSVIFGALCVRSYRWVLLWIVPESLLFVFLGYFLYCGFSMH